MSTINGACTFRSGSHWVPRSGVITSSCVLSSAGHLTVKSDQKIDGACTISSGSMVESVVEVTVFRVPRWQADAESLNAAPHTPWISNGKQPT